MSELDHVGAGMDRRELLIKGAQLAAVASVGSSLVAPDAYAKRLRWPSAKLPSSAASEIDPSQFFSKRLLQLYGEEANRFKLRQPGADNTELYVRRYTSRLRRAGLQGVRREPVPMKLWQARSWSLSVDGKKLPNTFYIPYTQRTGSSGVSAEMVFVDGSPGQDLKGKIAVFDVGYTALPLAAFAAASYPGALHNIDLAQSAGQLYERPWLNSVGDSIDAAIEGGAVGMIGIWPDLPGKWARQYTPYDAEFFPIPGLWLDSVTGAKVRDLAGNGAKATIKLDAKVRNVVSHNVIGFIPGKSKELTVLHTHTDGTNGMEENGQIGILGAAQYMARLPREALERTVMVYLSTGHFAGGNGIRHFLERHANDLVPRITSILTLEHLGCTEWKPGADGVIRPTGKPELGAGFCPQAQGMVDPLIGFLHRLPMSGTVARPFLPLPIEGEKTLGWPGEGTYFWMIKGLLDGNFITGPYGLITADLDISGMVDYKLMRKSAFSAVKATLELAAADRGDLQPIGP